MFELIKWRAYFKTKTEEKAKKLLNQFESALENKVELVSCEKYWKDESLYEVRFTTKLNINEISTAIFETLLIANKIAHSWVVSGPNELNQYWEFEALTDKTIILGVEWVSYRISNNLEEN